VIEVTGGCNVRSNINNSIIVSVTKSGPAKSDFDLLVRFYLKHFSLVRTGCGTTWAIRTIDFAGPENVVSLYIETVLKL
jgi:hypothetical protein